MEAEKMPNEIRMKHLYPQKKHTYSRLYPSVIATTFQAPIFIWVTLITERN